MDHLLHRPRGNNIGRVAKWRWAGLGSFDWRRRYEAGVPP